MAKTMATKRRFAPLAAGILLVAGGVTVTASVSAGAATVPNRFYCKPRQKWYTTCTWWGPTVP